MTTTAPIPTAAPRQRVPSTENGVITYTWIPQIEELLPKTGGLPGVEYLQCSAENQPRADAEGWRPVHRSRPYVIASPKDPTKRVAMTLLGCGEPLRSLSPYSGRRVCWVDKLVEERTGLIIESPNQPDRAEAP